MTSGPEREGAAGPPPEPAGNVPLWESGAALDRPPLAGEVVVDACVVGLGGSGLVCVRELTRLGLSVVGLDAGGVAGGAAGRNGGFLLAGLASFHHQAVRTLGRSRARALYEETVAERERIAGETPHLVRRGGSLRIAESAAERADCAAQFRAMRADGLLVEPYEGPEGAGLLVPGDGCVQPLERCRALARSALAEGALLYEHSAAVHIAGGRVETAAGAVRARYVVVAVDGRLERVLPELAPRVRTARLQMLATAPTTEIRLPRPVYARYGFDYWQQRPDGAIALGGGRDHFVDREWTHDESPTLEVQQHLERRLRQTLGVSAPITHRWGASVSYTASGLPVVGEVRPGVWVIGGYSGTGNVIGALLGRGLARFLALGDRSLIAPFPEQA